MGGRKRRCPCEECQTVGPAGTVHLVDPRTVKKHCEEIAAGTRRKALPYGFGLGDEDAEASGIKSAWPAARQQDQAEGQDLDQDEDKGPRSQAHANTVAAALEVVELVAQGTCTVTGAQAMLKCMATHFNEVLQDTDEGNIPQSWYMAMKLGLDGTKPKFFWRDFCNGVCAGYEKHPEHIFPDDSTEDKCPKCRYAFSIYTNSQRPVPLSYVYVRS